MKIAERGLAESLAELESSMLDYVRSKGGEALFRCGVVKGGPLFCVHLGGLEFPVMTQKVSGFGTETRRSDLDGTVLKLDAAKVKAVIASLARKVVRSTHGKKAKAFLIDKANRGYKAAGPAPGDRPLALFVYMEPVDEDPHGGGVRQTLGQHMGLAPRAVRTPSAAEAAIAAKEAALDEKLARLDKLEESLTGKAAKAEAEAKAKAEAEAEAKAGKSKQRGGK